MSKKEEFKNFVKKYPELAVHVKNNIYSWQDLYQVYDIYGEEKEVWDQFINVETDSRDAPLNELAALVKGVNLANVQKYINNAQKAINVVQELTTKTEPKIPEIPKTPRPINKFFGDWHGTWSSI